MSVPFLARMAKITGDSKYLDDAILQVENFSKYLYNKNNGLYFHCYYSDNGQNGVAHWGRCNGWVMMAQVELLSVLPEDHPKRNHLIHLLEDHIVGLSRYQDNSGMWHQLINKPDSYLESSVTAMIIYGVAKAVSEGWINPSYASIAISGWKGLVKKITEKGEVEDICVGTGIQDNLRFYYDRPTKLNDNHGLGAVILAGAEIIKLDLWMEQMKSK
jgi:rhamnogalacturonyl hydrolase YesR